MEQGDPMVSLPATEPNQLSSSSRMGCDQIPGKEQVGQGSIWKEGNEHFGLEQVFHNQILISKLKEIEIPPSTG